MICVEAPAMLGSGLGGVGSAESGVIPLRAEAVEWRLRNWHCCGCGCCRGRERDGEDTRGDSEVWGVRIERVRVWGSWRWMRGRERMEERARGVWDCIILISDVVGDAEVRDDSQWL